MNYTDRHIDENTASLSFEYDGFMFIAEFEHDGRYASNVVLHLSPDGEEIEYEDVENIVKVQIYETAVRYAEHMAEEINDSCEQLEYQRRNLANGMI